MRNIVVAAVVTVLSSFCPAIAGSARDSVNVRFAYDVNFEMNFDNTEYRTSLYPSMTIFGARLTPAVGLSVSQPDGMRHRLMAGIDVMKDFGRNPAGPEQTVSGGGSEANPEASSKQGNWNLFGEILLYYKWDASFRKTDMTMTAGIFPRSTAATYPRAFFSDSLRFYDNNLEGLLLQFRRPKSYYEVGIDWMGLLGKYRRERFMLFSSGKSQIKPYLSLGWYFTMYHYACSETAVGVVDNVLANPYINFDFAVMTPFQKLSLTIGWLQGAQQDRKLVGKYVFPCGGEAEFEIRKWNVGIVDKVFVGRNMMPYYDTLDPGGYKYGKDLYFGDPMYRLYEDGNTSSLGIYDRLEVYYEPRIASFLDLRIGLVAHFHSNGYSGFQQCLSLVFNLQELLDRRNSGRSSCK
ncbi:MAG: hypothetical protein ACI395_09745 [Candidatus Cryptobacteroides sp.]